MMPFKGYSEVKKESRTLAQFYADFNKLSKIEKIFPIITDVKMQERWNKLMVLVFLGALRPNFLKARLNVIGGFIVKSLEDIYHLREVVPSESENQAIVETQDRSTLTVQARR